jgi:hypothetical protein
MSPLVSESSAPPMPLRRTRRRYVVDRRFQYKYAGLLSGFGTAMSALFGVLMYLAHREALDAVAGGSPLRAEVAAGSDMLVWLIVGMATLMAVCLALFGVLVTHRVAGPVYVMSQFVTVLARGRYPTLRPLRRNDELRDFFDRFQHAIDVLRERERDEARILGEALERLASPVATPEVIEALEALRAMHARKCEATEPSAGLAARVRQSAA